jgi:flagellar biosynthesis protein FliR
MLNHPALYLHFWIILISLPNLIVIGLMVLVFILALILPFPRKHVSQGGER